MILLRAASSGRGKPVEAMLMRQLDRVVAAILDAHAAAGDARRAEQLLRDDASKFASSSIASRRCRHSARSTRPRWRQ